MIGSALLLLPTAALATPSERTAREHTLVQPAGAEQERLAGADRYETAAEVARHWKAGAPTAYVVSGQAFPDALAAAARAGHRDAPVLLTRSDELPAGTIDALRRLKPGRIVLVGGKQAVSPAVMANLAKYTTGEVTRVAGQNRYATAAKVAREYGSDVEVAYLASGESFPDALAGAALAGHKGAPLLLTAGSQLSEEARDALHALNPVSVVVLGGSAAVSNQTAQAAAAQTRSGTFTRVAGADRYATAEVVAAQFPSATGAVYVASETTYADALVGAARAGAQDVPLVLTRRDAVPDPTRSAVQGANPEAMFVLGGQSAISSATAQSLASVVGAVLPDRPFDAESFWYQELPDNTPTDPRSDTMVPWLREVGVEAWGDEDRDLPSSTINTHSYSPTIYATDEADPLVRVRWTDCWGTGHPEHPDLVESFTDVRIPADAVPGGGSDAPMALYDTTNGRYTDLFMAERNGGQWSACWGGSIDEASSNPGYFQAPLGSSASGLPLEPGAIKVEELVAGDINHALSLGVPAVAVDATISWPAQRTDGESTHKYALAEGQRLRLPASLNLNDYHFNAATLAVAEAAQNYGIVVTDRSGAFTFQAESPLAMSEDPYPDLFDGLENYSVLWGDPHKGEDPFPFEELEVLPVDYGQ